MCKKKYKIPKPQEDKDYKPLDINEKLKQYAKGRTVEQMDLDYEANRLAKRKITALGHDEHYYDNDNTAEQVLKAAEKKSRLLNIEKVQEENKHIRQQSPLSSLTSKKINMDDVVEPINDAQSFSKEQKLRLQFINNCLGTDYDYMAFSPIQASAAIRMIQHHTGKEFLYYESKRENKLLIQNKGSVALHNSQYDDKEYLNLSEKLQTSLGDSISNIFNTMTENGRKNMETVQKKLGKYIETEESYMKNYGMSDEEAKRFHELEYLKRRSEPQTRESLFDKLVKKVGSYFKEEQTIEQKLKEEEQTIKENNEMKHRVIKGTIKKRDPLLNLLKTDLQVEEEGLNYLDYNNNNNLDEGVISNNEVKDNEIKDSEVKNKSEEDSAKILEKGFEHVRFHSDRKRRMHRRFIRKIQGEPMEEKNLMEENLSLNPIKKNPIDIAKEDPISTLFSLFDTLFSSFDKKMDESNNNINKPSTRSSLFPNFTAVPKFPNFTGSKTPRRYIYFKNNPFRN